MASVLQFKPLCCYSLELGQTTVVGGRFIDFQTPFPANKSFRPNITIFFTLFAVGVSFAWLGVEHPSQWRAGVALYILGRKNHIYLPNYEIMTYCHSPVITYQVRSSKYL